MTSSEPIEIVPAASGDMPVLQNLIQLYTHDFTEFWDGGVMAADGRYPDYPLGPYFERRGWDAWLIRTNGALAGFALVNDDPHSGQAADRSMAEFFVLRSHRGRGLARSAARRLFLASPGLWEVAVARRNTPGQAFWRRVIPACAAPGSRQELDLDSPDWNGPVFRFRV
jgi:predicted acetyltransferase